MANLSKSKKEHPAPGTSRPAAAKRREPRPSRSRVSSHNQAVLPVPQQTPHPVETGHGPHAGPAVTKSRGLAPRFGINDSNLERRREFIRLGEEERELLLAFAPWAQKAAAGIAHAFYDWQFSFQPTLAFFENFAQARQLPLATLRIMLEKTQAGYIAGIFEGARANWGTDYFESRLNVGWVHDQINLPFKWYIGSYCEMQRLIDAQLEKDFRRDRRLIEVERAVAKVFNYDMQAVGDSFLLNTLDSLGLNVNSVQTVNGGDRTESLQQVKFAIHNLADQCAALAAGRLNDPVFDVEAPCAGKFGEAFAQIRMNFRESLLSIAHSASAVAASSEELTQVSQQMASSAEETSAQATVVATASDDVSRRVTVVASGTEEMQVAIQEIAKAASGSANVARHAVDASESARQTIDRLGASSAQISEVIQVISAIAQQTNFLALNATIEAARAGEAGKGFAVVANEVKELAKRTRRATEEIGKSIEAIRADSERAVEAIVRIGSVINEVNDNSNNIAAAVEEQTVTTNEISRNLADAATGTGDIAHNIGGVATAARDTTRGAADTQDAARALSQMSAELQDLVSRFQI